MQQGPLQPNLPATPLGEASIIAAKELATQQNLKDEAAKGLSTSKVEDGSSNELGAIEDTDNPVNWKPAYKWTLMVLVSAMAMLGAFATMTIVPAVPLILQDYHPPASYYSTLIVSIWELGEGLGPFAIGPLAEIYGRLPVLHVGNVVFLAFLIGSALSTSASMIIAMRFLSALFITPLTLSPTIASDLFLPEQCGTAMSIAMVLPLAVPPAAPIVGSFISDALWWRWTAWIVAIPSAAIALILFFVYRETYVPVIVRKRAKSKRTNNEQAQSDAQGHEITAKVVFRPLYLLAFAPPVSILCAFTGLAYSVNYLVFTTLTEMLEGVYGFDQARVGLGFLGPAIGMIMGNIFYGFTSDRYLQYRFRSRGKLEPEDRLPFVLCGAVMMPVGMVIYGWIAQYRVHWMAPIVGSGILGFGIMLVQTPVENYLVDAYEEWSASAVSIAVVVRALTGAILPLAGPSLYVKLGYGWGNTLLALILLAFAPMIVLLALRGESLRKSAKLDKAMRTR